MGKAKSVKAGAKLPKQVGGVKVPKKLRKAGAKLVAQATSPLGIELIAAGLSLASAAVAAVVERERAGRRAVAATGEDANPGAQPASGGPKPGSIQPLRASNDPHEIGVALGKMAEAALAGLLKRKP